jgi:hypothetical protein
MDSTAQLMGEVLSQSCVIISCPFFFFLLLFICAYKAWVISPPCPHPLPYHPLRPLPLPPTSSTSLVIKEMQIKTASRFHLSPVRLTMTKKTNNDKCWQAYREKGTLTCCWWECQLVQALRKSVWRSPKTQTIELLHDLAIPLLGTSLKACKSVWEIDCISVFTAAVFTTPKTQS